VVVVILLVFFVGEMEGLKVVKTEHLFIEVFRVVETFSFYDGGLAMINATINNDALVNLWLCHGKEDWNKNSRIKPLCKSNYDDCAIVNMNGSLFQMKTIRGVYSLVVVNCDMIKECTVKLNYTFLNPGGSQLSAGDEVKPWSYSILGIIWIIILLYLVITTIIGRRYLTPVHLLLFIISILRIMFVSSTVYYWYYYRSSGEREDFVNQLSKIFYIFSEGSYLFAIFLISNGWRITSSGIQRTIIRKALGSLIIFLSVLIFFCITSQYYYLLSLLVVYIIIIPRIFTNMTLILKKILKGKPLCIDL